MIQANELRGGNYIKEKGSKSIYSKVIMLDIEVGVVQCEGNINSPIEDYEPIPLTEEILLKCGFKKLASENKDFDASYVLNYIEINYHSRHGKFHFRSIPMDYLHELQNLYFALTKQELEINL